MIKNPSDLVLKLISQEPLTDRDRKLTANLIFALQGMIEQLLEANQQLGELIPPDKRPPMGEFHVEVKNGRRRKWTRKDE